MKAGALIAVVIVILLIVLVGFFVWGSSTTTLRARNETEKIENVTCKSDEVLVGRQCMQMDKPKERKTQNRRITENDGGDLTCQVGSYVRVLNAWLQAGGTGTDMTDKIQNLCGDGVSQSCYIRGGNWPRDFGWPDPRPGDLKLLETKFECIDE